jgi:hypothetical protein
VDHLELTLGDGPLTDCVHLDDGRHVVVSGLNEYLRIGDRREINGEVWVVTATAPSTEASRAGD